MRSIRNDQWIPAIEEDGARLWPIGMWASVFLYDLPTMLPGMSPWFSIFEFDNGRMRWYIPEAYSKREAEKLFQISITRPRYFRGIRKRVEASTRELQVFSASMLKRDVSRMSNKQLEQVFVRHEKLLRKLLAYGMIATLTDAPFGRLSDHLVTLLAKKVDTHHLPKTAGEYFFDLTWIPEKSMQGKEERALYSIAQRLIRDAKMRRAFKTIASARRAVESDAQLKRLIKRHVHKFIWASYNYSGPERTSDSVVRELVDSITSFKTSGDTPHPLTRAKQEISERTCKLSHREQESFQTLRDIMAMKIIRKDAMVYSFYALSSARKEIAKRAGISEGYTLSLEPRDFARVLNDPDFVSVIARRDRYTLLIADTAEKPPRLLLGDEGRAYIKKRAKNSVVGAVMELKGQPACIGKAQGIVRIINTVEDMKKMNTGDILVSMATTPDLVPAMRKASAIITEQGGITSHAAIVSRELHVPCVIGTLIATRVLNDGDEVEVDASAGRVTVLRRV